MRLNESAISMVLGLLVLVAIGVLAVNYFRGLNKVGEITNDGARTEEVGSIPGGKHTVSKGETLWSISEKYYGTGYNWVDIARENNISDADAISEGMELKLPNVEKRVVAENDSEIKIEGNSYTVVKGDTLWNIAGRAYGDNYQWVKIASENKLANPNLIHPGNVFVIPR